MINTRVKSTLSIFLIALTLLRSFTPVGWMPDIPALAHGKIDFVICTGFSTKTIAVDLDTFKQDAHHSTQHTSNTLCPFFGLTSFSLPILLINALLFLLGGAQRFSCKPLFRWFAYFNESAPPRAPPHVYC